ncbi:formiminotransferase N-terminal subdomain-containing protein isoform 3-T4 [Menidia menidia]
MAHWRNMFSSTFGKHLVACLLNVSEAHRQDLVETVARAALYSSEGVKRKTTTVLNIFNDHDYNRSVITIVSSIDSIREAVLSACERACEVIDMSTHIGVHPCMGAIDLIPIYPLGEKVGVEACAQEARGVGASPYVMNCNVTIDTQDITIGRSIARAIRESTTGGLAGVQVLALPHEGAVEMACNVESVRGPPKLLEGEPWPSFSIDGQPYCHVPASLITSRVAELAGRQGVGMKGTALVGFTPCECRGLAEFALSQGIGEFWKEQRKINM